VESTETRWQRHVDQGRRFVSQGNYAEAEQSLLAAVKEALTLGPADLRVASSLGILGKLKHRQGDRERAQGFLERALAVREEALGPDHYGVVHGLNDLAALHYAYGQLAEARQLYERALAIAEKQLAPDHADIALALYNLARVYFKAGDHLRAEPLLSRLLAIKERTLGPDHTDIAAILTALSRVRSMAGRHDEAEEMARRALAIREHALAPDDQAIAVSLELVAYFCAGRAKRMRSLADAERILGGAREPASHNVSRDAAHAGSDSSLEAELAKLAAEEQALRERAREIRGRSGGHREPPTLERSPAPPEAARREEPAAAKEPTGPESVAATPSETVATTPPESVSAMRSESASSAVPSMSVSACVTPATSPAATASACATAASAHTPAAVATAAAPERAAIGEEKLRSPGEASRSFFDRKRFRWLFGIAALALLGAGGAGFAMGRGAHAPRTEALAPLQESSRGVIEEPQAGSIQSVSHTDAAMPMAAPPAAHAAVPSIPDWDRPAPRTVRAARIPSRSQARRLTHTMERLGDKAMAGVDAKVDSMSRVVELPPLDFEKP